MKELSVGTKVDHIRYGEGIIGKVNAISYDIYFSKAGKIEILKSNQDISILEEPEESDVDSGSSKGINLEDMEKMISYTLDKYAALQEIVPLGEKWTGGKLIIQPLKNELQSKEIPIDVFFHKIVMLRDRLRVLEQNINSHPKLTDEEKVDFQQYITRIYGSLTTFNILFKEKEHYFIGSSSK